MTQATATKYEALKAELNEIRANQKKVSDFKSVAEWLAYGQKTAKRKAEILAAMEGLFK